MRRPASTCSEPGSRRSRASARAFVSSASGSRAQVDALDNARLREGIEVKPSDSRSQTYLVEHGDQCWEVDILPATVIEQALEAHIRGWLDERLWRQRDREIERARALI